MCSKLVFKFSSINIRLISPVLKKEDALSHGKAFNRKSNALSKTWNLNFTMSHNKEQSRGGFPSSLSATVEIIFRWTMQNTFLWSQHICSIYIGEYIPFVRKWNLFGEKFYNKKLSIGVFVKVKNPVECSLDLDEPFRWMRE